MLQRAQERVVLVVFDGLRPDMARKHMPALTAYAGGGSWFNEARSVFPSMTRVATTSIATGVLPCRHGIVGNAFYFPETFTDRICDLGKSDHIAAALNATQGALFEHETVFDRAARFGRHASIVCTGGLGTVTCLNPRARQNGQWVFAAAGPHACSSPVLFEEICLRFGSVPGEVHQRIAYAADVFVEEVLTRQSPDLSVLWLNEPDNSFHYDGLGSDAALRTLSMLDRAFAQVVSAIDRRADRDRFSVIVASDHGHITIDREVDLVGLLSDAGHPVRHHGGGNLEGCDLAFTGWNMGTLSLLRSDDARLRDIAAVLRAEPSIGNLFSRSPDPVEGSVEGSFSHALVGIDHPRTADLVFTMRAKVTVFGHHPAGHGPTVLGGDVPVGGGMHGGLNRFELNSTLIASGAGFAAGGGRDVAVSVCDIAPTLDALLGLPTPQTVQGRSLIDIEMEPVALVQHACSVGDYCQSLALSVRQGMNIVLHGARDAAARDGVRVGTPTTVDFDV